MGAPLLRNSSRIVPDPAKRESEYRGSGRATIGAALNPGAGVAAVGATVPIGALRIAASVAASGCPATVAAVPAAAGSGVSAGDDRPARAASWAAIGK